MQLTSFALSLSVIEFQTLVLRGDVDAAMGMLEEIPKDQKAKIARFLEGQGEKELALEVAEEKEQRFDLALALGKLDVVVELAREADVEHKWKTVGDAALAAWDVRLAEECFLNAKDLGSLLLLYSASCNGDGLRDLAAKAKEAGLHNVAFSCLWQTGDVDACLDLLLETKRTAEAVLFAQTYRPSRCHSIAKDWKSGLEKNGKGKVARLLGVPPAATANGEGGGGEVEGDEEMFPEWEDYLRLEKEGSGFAGADLIDVNGNEAQQKAKANPVEAGGDEGDGDGDVTPQTDIDV